MFSKVVPGCLTAFLLLFCCTTAFAQSGSSLPTATITPLKADPGLTTITVSPAGSVVPLNSSQQFTAVGYDLAGNPMSPQPTFSWSVAGGVGSISQTGLYSAGSTAGTASVMAISGNVYGTASLTVSGTASPVTVTALTLSPTSVIGALTNGTQSTGTVTISPAAPAGGAAISLASNNTSIVTLPASVTIPAGSTSNTFVITASNVTSQANVQISAISSTNTVSQPLVVNPWLQQVTFPSTNVVGGNTITGIITLNAQAPNGGLPVTVTTNNSGVTVAGGSTVTIPAGSLTGTFTLSTTAVTANTSVTISTSYSALTLTNNVSVVPLLASLSLNPYTVTGGTPSTGTITLNGAQTSPITVSLTSSSAYVQVPASVSIAANATSQTFPITTGVVTSVTASTIAASYGGASVSQQLTLNPMSVSLSISPTSVVGGTTTTGTVTLSGQAPTGGITVSLTSSNTSCATVPTSIAVPAGTSSAQFTITTKVVTSNTYCQIQAAYGGLSSSGSITVMPLLNGLSLSTSSLVGGGSVTGTITLNGPAPTGGAVVNLSSSSSSASVPASVTVAAGNTQQTVTITTSSVASYTNATITASNAGTNATAYIYLSPMLSNLSINPYSIYGGGTVTGTVNLNAAAPTGGIVVTLSSSNTAVATTPASVTVVAGNNSATFTITTSAVTSNTSVTIQAAYAGATSSQSLAVVPLLSSVGVAPQTVLGGGTSTGTVNLSTLAPTGGVTIALSSSAVSVATVPATVTVAAGAQSATFTVTAQPVTSSSSATISATYAGVTQTTSLSVVPLLSYLSLNPTMIVGGDPSTGTISFNRQTTSAVTIALSSTNANAVVPASVSVPSGSSSATFTITSRAVSAATPSTISAAYAGVTETSTLTIEPMPTVQSVTMYPGSVNGGSSVNGSVMLSSIAPAAGAVVTLSQPASTCITIPASVTVQSGQTSASFSVSTTPVSTNTSSLITAAYNGSSASVTLTDDRPTLRDFYFAQTSIGGGNTDVATIDITSPAPTGGVTINLSCVLQNATGSGASFPSSVTVPAGATSVAIPVQMSTVNSPVVLVFTAANSVASSESLTANVTVTDATLHASDVVMPKGIVLQWGVSAVGNLLLYRNGALIATLPNTATTYTDTFNWNSGQTYTYTIFDGNTSPATLLSTEQAIPVLAAATQDQAIDSRLDPRYSAIVYMDHQFGSSAYRGGLFAGYFSDPSRIGRSFAEFTLAAVPSSGVYRVGKVNAYLVTGDTDNGAIAATIGCQTMPNNNWNASTLTWDTAPTSAGFNPASAAQTISVQYDPSAPCALVPTGGSGQATLSWAAPATTKTIVGYTVEYGTSSGYYSSSVTGVTGTSTTITGLTNGTTYYFWVVANYSDGTSSGTSQMASITPPNSAGVGTPPNEWYSWALSNDIYSLAQAGGGPYSVAWASTNETNPAWVYFAKNEYDGVHGPVVTELYSLPTLLRLQVPTSVSSAGGSGTGSLTVNAIGLQGSALVTLTSSNPAVASVPSSITVTGLNNNFTITLARQTVSTAVTITATLGSVSISRQMSVTP